MRSATGLVFSVVVSVSFVFASAALRTVNVTKCCKFNEYLTIGDRKCMKNESSSWNIDIYNARKGRLDVHNALPPHWRVKDGVMPNCANPRQLIFQGKNNIPFMNGSLLSLEFDKLFHPSQLCIDYNLALVCLNEPENLTYIKKCCGENAIFSQTNSTCRQFKDDSYKINVGQNQTLGAGFPACIDSKIHVVGEVNISSIFGDGSILVQNNTILPAANFCLEYVFERTGRSASIITCPEYLPQQFVIVEPQKTEVRFILCSIGLALSAIFLAATLAAGTLLPASHHVLHWRCQTNHVSCLFVGDVLLCITQLSSNVDYIPCFAIAVVMHFVFLAAFFWLNTMCFNIWWTFRLKGLTRNDATTETKKKELLIHSIGTKTLQILCNLTSPEEPNTKSYKELTTILKNYLDPTPSEIAEQNKFSRRIQKDGECVADFITDLRKLSKNCQFVCASCKASTIDEHIRQQFISGLRDSKLLEKLIQLKSPDNTLKHCVDLAISMETAEKESREIHNSQFPSTVGQIQLRSRIQRTEQNSSSTSYCYRCGDKKHFANTCRHINSICNACGKQGHLQVACMKGKFPIKNSKKSVNTSSVHQVNSLLQHEQNYSNQEYIHDEPEYYMNTLENDKVLNECQSRPGKFMVQIMLNKKLVRFEWDTGAAVSTMSEQEFKSLFPGKLIRKSNLPLRTYTGEILNILGYATMQIDYGNEVRNVNLYIIRDKVDAICGREWMKWVKLDIQKLCQIQNDFVVDEHTKISTLQKLKNEFPDVFKTEVGKINNFVAELKLKENTSSVYRPARTVPYALKEKVDAEIDRLEKLGIISKIEYSEWGTPVVPILKGDNSIRLCADYKSTINNLLKDDHYPIPHIEDIFVTAMTGGKIFSTLDIREAYLHMPMSSESARIQAISTSKGNYQVNRMMFGTKVAPSIWQRYISQTLENIPGVCVFFDDIQIQGATFEEHLQRVRTVLSKLRDVGLRIKEEKSQFFKSSINYLGYKITTNGLTKTKEKVEAVTNAPQPSNVSELKSWLGLVNYYGRFVKNLAMKMNPLYKLLQKERDFVWSKDCAEAFKLIKEEITSDEVLCPYNPNLPLVLASDASPFGLWAIISHIMPSGEERPIAYASRTLSAAERNYSQIDKEATAIFWGVNKFFRYCYGRKFKLVTDHLPLVSIFKPNKNLPSMVATRMLHYAQFLQGFDYEIIYKSTKQHGNVDALSRLPIESKTRTESFQDDVTIFQLENMSVLPITYKQIARETVKDSNLRVLYVKLQTGLPLKNTEFSRYENEFSLEGGCIMRGLRTVIPSSLRNGILCTLHVGHIGMTKMKALARSYVWWLNIDKDIENITRTCKECCEVQREASKGTVHCWEFPSAPWQRLHIDFAGPFLNNYFFIVVDAFSKWPEVYPMSSITSFNTIEKLREIFARFGLPLTIVSDNGPTFTSREFDLFLKSNGIQHKLIAPYHPSTNGQVERYVQTLKMALKKTVNDSGTLNLKLTNFLLQYRKTPNATTGLSPSSLLLKRDIRTISDLTKPNLVDEMREKQNPIRYKGSVNFEEGQSVVVRNYNEKDRKWKFAEIVRKDGPLNYLVRVEGQLWKRHADQIKPSMPFTNRTDVTSKSENENTATSSRIPVITLPENRNEVGFEDKSGETIEKDVQKEQNTEHNDINCACNEDGSGTGKSQDQTATMIRRSSRIRKQHERFSYD